MRGRQRLLPNFAVRLSTALTRNQEGPARSTQLHTAADERSASTREFSAGSLSIASKWEMCWLAPSSKSAESREEPPTAPDVRGRRQTLGERRRRNHRRRSTVAAASGILSESRPRASARGRAAGVWPRCERSPQVERTPFPRILPLSVSALARGSAHPDLDAVRQHD